MTCADCGHVQGDVGDFDDTVALCTDHNEGPFCGPCFENHADETGCGLDDYAVDGEED